MEKKKITVTGPEDQTEEILKPQEPLQEEHPEEVPVLENKEVVNPEHFEEVAEEIIEEIAAEELTSTTENTEVENDDMKKTKDTEKMAVELAEMKDKYLRLYAEFDNYRKRTLREREDLFKTAAQETIKSLLSTLDDFERAMKLADTADNSESIPEGIRLIYDKLFRTLAQQGLQAMESDGQPFNTDLHEALTKIPAPVDDLKGKVIETIEKGYYLKDKIIRYAKVVVGV